MTDLTLQKATFQHLANAYIDFLAAVGESVIVFGEEETRAALAEMRDGKEAVMPVTLTKDEMQEG